jgi:sulfur-carrier protein adenylyltransferase/sulfurtransferase
MPNDLGITLRLREEGILRADSFLQADCGAHRLSDGEVQSIEGRSIIAGWQITIQTPVSTRRINICVDAQFPFSLPHFFLVDRPPYLTWPHIEEDGLLCLPQGSIVTKLDQPAAVIGQRLQEAYRLILDCESGANENDFRIEFYSYWNRRLSASNEAMYSLLNPRCGSRLIQIWRGETCSVVGETEEQVLTWLRHKHGEKPQFSSTDPALLVWIKEPLLPKEYPDSAADLLRIATSLQGGGKLLESFAKFDKSPFYFVIGADSDNGPCFAGVRASRPVFADIRGRKRDRSVDGFRPGKAPQALLTQRLFTSTSTASRIKVDRVDPGWIHGRDHDPRQKEVYSKTVILIGCGSVGGPIAQSLTMAGVGRLLLVDDENLSWANVGRHPLGAESVGQNKAKALADRLQKSYPHSRIDGFDMTYERFAELHPDLISNCDLIISATADWKSERILNLRQFLGEIAQPIVYVSTEPNACAGHAVLILPGGPCFQCGLHPTGSNKLEVTVWPAEKKERFEPACGAVFQQYGPIELLGTLSIGASVALDSLLGRLQEATHRIWAGPQSLLQEAGGSWSEEWIMGNLERAKGGFQEERTWARDSLCASCSGNNIEAKSYLKSANLDSASSSELES